MTDAVFAELSAWLTQAGLAGMSEIEIVSGFCDHCVAAGLPVARALMFVDTLHPVHEGRLLRWGYGPTELPLVEYGRTTLDALGASGAEFLDVDAAQRWRQSPHYKMLQTGDSFLRRRLDVTTIDEFPVLSDFLAAGMTDYVAIISRFAPEGVIGRWMACTCHGQQGRPTGSATTKSPRFSVSRHIWRSLSNRCRLRA